ncbi:MAG: hypothetical protein ABI644_05555 [Arenimonas sp.]
MVEWQSILQVGHGASPAIKGDNYAAWLELKPQFVAQLDLVATKMRAALPAFQPDPGMKNATVVPVMPVTEAAPVAAIAEAAPVAEALATDAQPVSAEDEKSATDK